MVEPRTLIGAKVHIDFRKWPDAKHWQYSMEYLGEDEHGHWLWAPAGTLAYRGSEGPLALPRSSVKLISGDWWVATWRAENGRPWEIYVDIISPASWSGGRVTMVDRE
jgi:uncharacterized protein